MDYLDYVTQAIKTAKSLREKTNGPLAQNQLKSSLQTRVANPINQQYPRNLISVASQELGKQIYTKSWHTADDIDALLLNYKNKVIIRIHAGHTPCASRFLHCKEILNLYLLNERNTCTSQTDVQDLIKRIIDKNVNNSETAQADEAAYYGAVELLIPTNIVPVLVASGLNTQTLATYLGAPKNIVEYRLDPRRSSIFDTTHAT